MLGSSVLLMSQNEFAKNYLAGEAQYKNGKGDLATAEKSFLAALRSADAKPERGERVRLTGKQYGYYPEYYLTLIYQRQHRYIDVLSYGARARKYLKESDKRFTAVKLAEDEALLKLSNVPTDQQTTWTRTQGSGQRTGDPTSFALIIGINRYDDPALQTLHTPIPDGVALAGLLHDGYGFETTFLPDPKRDDILTALDNYLGLSDTSSLLIYYGGHGVHLADDKNYWLPSDAPHNPSPKWIEALEITSRLKAIRARHLLLIADSCYSGLFTKGLEVAPAYTKAQHDAFLRSMAAARSRQLMSSGFDEPVPDIGAGDHSKFAAALLSGLGSMPQASFTAGELFSQFVNIQVTSATGQRPQYIPITEAAHGGGDFVFYRVQSK